MRDHEALSTCDDSNRYGPSTCPAKHKSDNEEIVLKQPHQDAFTPKHEILERINWLHIKCGFLDTEHLFMLLINWLNNSKVPDVNVDIVQNFCKAYCSPKYVFVDKYFNSWDPKIHGPRNYLQSFYAAALIDKCVTTKYYPLAMFRYDI